MQDDAVAMKRDVPLALVARRPFPRAEAMFRGEVAGRRVTQCRQSFRSRHVSDGRAIAKRPLACVVFRPPDLWPRRDFAGVAFI